VRSHKILVPPKLLDEDTKQLDEYKPEFVRNLKGHAENEYEFQLSKKRSPRPSTRSSSPRHPLAENEYSIAGHWIAGQNTEHRTQNTSSVKVREMTSSFRSILLKEHA
jgi:hypothetical protein